MTLLDRYLLPQLLQTSLFAILIFTIAWLAPEILFQAIEGVNQKQITLGQAGEYLVLQIPAVLMYCIPISALFGSVFFFRKISLSSELIAILASGIAFRRVLVPVALVGLSLMGLFVLNQEVLNPKATVRLRHLTQNTGFQAEELPPPQVTFLERTPTGQLSQFVMITPEGTDSDTHAQFIALQYTGAEQTLHIDRIITAQNAQWTGQAWQLQNGIDYELDAAGIYRQIQPFSQKQVQTQAVIHDLLAFSHGNAAELSTAQLSRYVRLLLAGEQREDARFYEVRWWQRFILPVAPLVLALLGAALGIERSRSSKNWGLTYAAILLLVYNVLIPTSTTLGSIGMLPITVAAFLPLTLTSLLGWGMIQLRQTEG